MVTVKKQYSIVEMDLVAQTLKSLASRIPAFSRFTTRSSFSIGVPRIGLHDTVACQAVNHIIPCHVTIGSHDPLSCPFSMWEDKNIHHDCKLFWRYFLLRYGDKEESWDELSIMILVKSFKASSTKFTSYPCLSETRIAFL